MPDDREADGRRKGRGRLSSIEMLPEECDEDIAWANAALRDKKLSQTEILRQFNERLAARGIKEISVGAFSRWSVRMAMEMRRLDASRQLMNEALARLDHIERSNHTIAATEMLKVRILEQALAPDDPDPKLLHNATLAIQRLTSTVAKEAELQRRDKADQRTEEERAAEQEAKKKADAEAAERIDKIATEAGLSADRLAAIRKGVLGLAG